MSMNIPQEAIDSLPWGMEIKVGDGVWVKPRKTLFWLNIEWTTVSSDEGYIENSPSIFGYIYALPVTLAGYELVKVGEVIPQGPHKNKKRGEICECDGPSGLPVELTDSWWHFRPIAVPVVEPLTMPVVEPVKCPFCGAECTVSSFADGEKFDCSACKFSGPKCADESLALAAFKRITVAPEPLRCPCGDAGCKVTVFDDPTCAVPTFQAMGACGIRGKRMPEKEQAESEFRKLTYGGGK